MGDFTGFSFDGVSSEDLGIIRVSDGDRYDENLSPEINDITAEVPGMHGEYYFGSTYGTREFEISIAYDSITEEQFRKLRKVFSGKGIHELIYDERPYKKYLVKLASPIELSFVCFDEPKRRPAAEPVPDSGVRVVNRTYTQMSEVNSPEQLTVSFNNPGTLDNGSYSFIYSVEEDEWLYNNESIVLGDFGISIEGEPEDGDIINLTLTLIVDSIEHEATTPWVYEYDGEGNYIKERIYKGDGTINLIAYYPFAKSVFKQLPSSTEYANVNDWAFSSGLLSETARANIDIYHNSQIQVYNAGDIETGFRLYIPSTLLNHSISIIYQKYWLDIEPDTGLYLKPMTMKVNGKDGSGNNITDIGVLIDTNNGIIVGVVPQTIDVIDPNTGDVTTSQVGITYDENDNPTYYTSGNLYNEYVDKGSFFKLEPNETATEGSFLIFENAGDGVEIFYDYLYF